LARPEVEPSTPLAKRLREVRKALGNPERAEFAVGLDISKSTIAFYERGERTPDANVLKQYRDRHGVDLNWLITGEGDMFQSSEVEPTGLPAPIMDFNQPDFVRLPIYNDVHASAGPGSVPVSEQADGVVAFTRRFLANQGARPDHCSVIWARGTSMKPTIPDGALLVVDHSQREVEHGCIYVFNVSDRLLVKRARWRLDGRLELVSDNADEGYPVETFGAESVDQLRVVGRVVYFGRTP